jgi:hypothetical protein
MKQWLANIWRSRTRLTFHSLGRGGAADEQLRQALQGTAYFCERQRRQPAKASHLATDLGKGDPTKVGRRFRIFSLNDYVSWLTAMGND